MTTEDKAAFNNWWQSTGGGRIGEKLQAEHAVKWALEYARQQSTHPAPAVAQEPVAEVHPLSPSGSEYRKAYNTGFRAGVKERKSQAVAVDEQFAVLIKKANDQAEHFEREWYLRGDELEALEQVNAQLLEALKELMYARTDKAEGMADAAIAAAEAAKEV